ncbi:MAG: trimethylamine methyltransferase family protein [Phycisphaerales bacterium]|nr:trimethylamine methyltransferase family protein [Phycisphaerales bacterium]
MVIAEEIHEASLKLLDDPGVKVEHDAIRELLLKNGAKAGIAPETVRIPREMVAEWLKVCPKEVVLADRWGNKRTLSSAGAPVFWSNPGMQLWRQKGGEGEHRLFTSKDMADIARLMHHLEHVHAVFGLALADVPVRAQDVVGLAIMAKNTSKHIRVLCFTPEGGRKLLEMQKVVRNDPWFSVGFTAHGPLRWTKLALEIFQATSGQKIPATINGEPMAGVSGPVTLAGSAAVGNAEILSGLLINQLLEPGRPCIYNLGLAHIFDMRSAMVVTGAPENALFATLSAVMGRFYNLPSASWVSTESMCPDSQAALEKMFGFHSHMTTGVTNIWGVGQLESELTISPAQAVIDNEMIAYAKRFHRGVQVTEETLALNITREIGPAGSFLETDHTADHFREELWMPPLLWRQKRAAWTDSGSKRLDERAESLADELIAKPVNNALTADQIHELDRIADGFMREVAG